MNTPTPDDLAHAAPDEVETEDLDAQNDADRRGDPRIPYDRRVVALGAEAARVLVGRDLSQGGMRIGASDSVCVGDVLRIALHCGTEIEPLIVLATAIRKDSQDGICLSFDDLTDSQRALLEKIIASSGPIRAVAEEFEDEFSDDEPDFEPSPVVLGEMLETVGRRSLGSIDADDAIDRHLDSIFDTN